MAGSYANAEFTISDAGTKMEAASKSNETLQMLLISMAVIVFIVGGIGIMNVLFASVKERTNEIGILKALGITPVIESFQVRVELSVSGALMSLVFGVVTGMLFGFYPAYKASSLIPVVALNQD